MIKLDKAMQKDTKPLSTVAKKTVSDVIKSKATTVPKSPIQSKVSSKDLTKVSDKGIMDSMKTNVKDYKDMQSFIVSRIGKQSILDPRRDALIKEWDIANPIVTKPKTIKRAVEPKKAPTELNDLNPT
jgi:hypothetical protein